jgi:hypothetical protein
MTIRTESLVRRTLAAVKDFDLTLEHAAWADPPSVAPDVLHCWRELRGELLLTLALARKTAGVVR